jgi:hypothetical protein
MRTSLTKRIGKLEGAMMQMQRIQDKDCKPADLSMLSIEELVLLCYKILESKNKLV